MIAISYRREDSLPITGRLYDRLQAKFGKRNVFMDFDSIRPGLDFREQIKQTIERSNVVIAIIGPRWVGKQSGSSRRIDDPNDFVRLEIAHALSCDIPVIPVLVNNTPMPKQESLPPDIRGLSFRHALPLDSGLDFHQHTDRLISGIHDVINKTKPGVGGGLLQRSEVLRHRVDVARRIGNWSAAIWLTVIGLVVASAGFYVFSYRSGSRGLSSSGTLPVAPAIVEKSVAVLPFENLSRDPDNAYFADGIQDEILTRLSKITDLKVISRTSTQHYRSAPENVPEIGKQLGVAHILEGSVQKSGDAVRVNVQLIKTANDSHLWADTFDRKLTDIFSVESEVAKAIADQLRAKLTGQEEQALATKPTDNAEAYDAYLRGLAYSLKTLNTPANALGTQKYLQQAVRLDPKLALAWALLSFTDAVSYITRSLQPTVALREEARRAAETAMTLQPKLGEAVVAKGYYHYACLKDYDSAVRYLEQARQFLPNSSLIPESLAYVARRRGRWDQSESYFNAAERLDPRNVELLTQHALSYINLRRFPEALRKLDQVLDITPDDVETLATKAAIAQAQGDLPRAAALLAPFHPEADDQGTLERQIYQAILQRNPALIIPRLKEILAKPDPSLGYINGELRFWLGWAQGVAGDDAVAKESWQQARSELESFLKEQPENFSLIGDLALINMALGEKAAAFSFVEKGIAAVPIEKDAMAGPSQLEILARVSAQMGEPNRAVDALQKLLSTPYEAPLAPGVPLPPALLRLDPMFDPLRNDPRFQKLCEEKQK